MLRFDKMILSKTQHLFKSVSYIIPRQGRGIIDIIFITSSVRRKDMKLKRTIAMIAAAVLALSLTACGKDTENTSSADAPTQSTSVNSSTSAPKSSTSKTEGGTSSPTAASSDTSSAEKPVEEPPQPKKIPLTDEELREINIGPISTDFFKTYERSGRSFDLTTSIDNIEMFDFILGRLVRVIETDEADYYERLSDPTWMDDIDYYYFKPETAEKLIREKFLPSFEISSVDHTKSTYWDTEKGQFGVNFAIDGYIGGRGRGRYDYLNESGYKIDGYYFINLVPLNDYPMTDVYFEWQAIMAEQIKMSDITSEYFAIPRVRVKLKKFAQKSPYEDVFYDTFILVGFEPVDERLEWVKTAENVYNTMKNDGIFQDGQPYSAGVMDGGLGKRIYLSSYSEMGSHRFTRSETIITYGSRDKGDVITVNRHNGGALNYMETDPQKMWGETYGGCTIEDKLKDEKYSYSFDVFEYPPDYTGSYFEDSPPTYKHNGKEISEDEYNSAELVRYFEGNENKIYTCNDGIDKITLGEYFEMCRIITD